MNRVTLRRATPVDAAILEQWDEDPDVIAATTDDPTAELAFGGVDWHEELSATSDAAYYLVAEVDRRPFGAMQICIPHEEPTQYWGEVVEPDLRAVDIWIGRASDRGRGLGAEMMRLAHELCFGDPRVRAIVIDPLASNHAARRFYERLGYVEVGPRRFEEDECVVYRFDRSAWSGGAMPSR